MGHLGIHACTEPHEAQIIVWYLSFKTFRFVNIHVYNDCMSNACLNTACACKSNFTQQAALAMGPGVNLVIVTLHTSLPAQIVSAILSASSALSLAAQTAGTSEQSLILELLRLHFVRQVALHSTQRCLATAT